MTSLDIFPPEILEEIIEYLPLKDRFALRRSSRRYYNFVSYLRLRLALHLCIFLISNNLRVYAPALDGPVADRFRARHKNATTRKRVHEDSFQVDCSHNLPFPPNLSLFIATRIRHVEIIKSMPIYLDNGNIERMTNALNGCKVDKITLVFDKKSLSNLRNVPPFLASIYAEHVEFILQCLREDDTPPFLDDDFADGLANAGIREVTFLGERNRGLNRRAIPSSELDPGIMRHKFPISVPLKFFAVGISTVTLNQRENTAADGLDDLFSCISQDDVYYLLHRLPRRRLRLLYIMPKLVGLPEGRYRRTSESEYSEIVRVTRQCTVIDINADQSAKLEPELGILPLQYGCPGTNDANCSRQASLTRDTCDMYYKQQLAQASRRFSDCISYCKHESIALSLDEFNHLKVESISTIRGRCETSSQSDELGFPPDKKLSSLLLASTIGHLKMSKDSPIFFDDGVLNHLTEPASFTAHKVTVIFDKKTIPELLNVLPFLASLKVKHVEFVLQKTLHYDMIEEFRRGDFAAKLVNAGVGAVTFTGMPTDGRAQAEPTLTDHPGHGPSKPSFAFDLLLNLFGAGIDTVIVNEHALENAERAIDKGELDALLEKMCAFSKPLQLQLTLSKVIEDLPDGRYERIKDEQEIVYVAGQLITIMHNPREE